MPRLCWKPVLPLLLFLFVVGCDDPEPTPEPGGDVLLEDTTTTDTAADTTTDTAGDAVSSEALKLVWAEAPSLTGERLSVAVTYGWDGADNQPAEVLVTAGRILHQGDLELRQGKGQIEVGDIDVARELESASELLVRVWVRIPGTDVATSTPHKALLFSRGVAAEQGLEATSTIPLRIDTDDFGVPDLMTGRVPVDGATPRERAWTFLETYGALFGVESPREQLQIGRVKQDETDDNPVVVFYQRHLGLQVLGGELHIELEGSDVLMVTANIAHDLPADFGLATFGADRIAAHVVAQGWADELTAPPRLFWQADSALLGRLERAQVGRLEVRKVWRVAAEKLTASGARMPITLTLDASDGALLGEQLPFQPCKAYDKDFQIFDSNNTDSMTCYKLGGEANQICNEGPCESQTYPGVVEGWGSAHTTYAWFYDNLCRRGWDGHDGAELEVYTNSDLSSAGEDSDIDAIGMWNLYWHCIHVAPFQAGSLRLMGHEYTHAIGDDEDSADDDGFETEALSEGFADVFGNLVEDSSDSVYDFDLRSDSPMQSVSVKHYDDMITEGATAHTNDGLVKYSAFLISEGGQIAEGGYTIEGIGAEKMARLYYDVFRKDIFKTTAFHAFGRRTAARAQRFVDDDGAKGFTQSDACAVRNAMFVVGLVDESDIDCNGDLENPDDLDDDGIPNDEDRCFDPDANDYVFSSWIINGDDDDDGIPNGCDDDIDGDGIRNDNDTCPLREDEGQEDLDGDGRGDICDIDADGDGVQNKFDNCPETANSEQLDTDRDGQGNACDDNDDGDSFPDDNDLCPLDVSNDNSDVDEDLLAPACDNCPEDRNPNQLDNDADGEGDACDRDDDNDGVLDPGALTTVTRACQPGQSVSCYDNCQYVYNPGQEDEDLDGTGDACVDIEQLKNFVAELERGVALSVQINKGDPNIANTLRIPAAMCTGVDCDDGLGGTWTMRVGFNGVEPGNVFVRDALGELAPDFSETTSDGTLGGTAYTLIYTMTYEPSGALQGLYPAGAFPTGQDFAAEVGLKGVPLGALEYGVQVTPAP